MTLKNTLLASCLLILSCFAFGGARAQTKPETVVVTATRSPQALSKVGASITVLSNQTIVASQAIATVDLLRDVPGVSFSRNGGVGSLTSVRIRGAESDQTVLLIDGIKLNDPSSPGGGYDFANLLLGDVEQIEVLRGPQSTLYGSQALGGVINIITRSGDVPFGANVAIEGGDLATYNARANVRGTLGGLNYAAAVGHFETDGISAAASGTEKDSFSNDGAQVRLNFRFNDALDVEGRVYWSNSDVGIDGFPAPTFALADTPERSETEEWIGYLGATLSLLDGRSRTRFGISQTSTDRTSLNPALSVPTTFLATGTNQRFEVQSTFDVTPDFQLVAGGELEEAKLRTASPSSFNPNPTPLRATSELGALFVQGQATPVSWLTATVGARWTTNDRFGEALNVRATVASAFNDGNTIVRAAIADGYKAPTPFQLFSNFGTPGLQPEEAASTEVGLEQAFFSRRLIASVTAYQRDTTNQIDFISCFGSTLAICVNRPFGTYDNVAKARAKGLEYALEAKPIDGLTISAGHATLDARNRDIGTANFKKRLPRRADTTSFVSVGYQFGFGLDLSATYTRIGDSFNNPSNSVRLAGYDLVSVRASQKIGDTWTIFGRVENAQDSAYQTVAGYGSPPRQAFVGLRASF